MSFFSAAVRHLRHLPTLSVAWLALAVAVACTLQNSTPNCGAGLTACNNQCVTTGSDPLHCGGCGLACPATAPFCSLGQCKATCDGGLMQCGSSCANFLSDAAHCGGCGMACQPGQSCTNGVCGCVGAGCGVGGGANTGGAFGSGAASGVGGSGAVTGSGAASSSGGSGAVTGSGGAGGGSGGTPLTDTAGGYLVGGDWKGYVWTGVEEAGESTITPANFEGVLQPPYCASGAVKWKTDYSGVGIWGWTLNQAPKAMPTDPDPPIGSVTPTLEGVTVNVTAVGTAQLRVQIQAPDETFWCTTLGVTGADHFIPWSDFVTNCWTGGTPQTPYANQPIESIMITVPGPGETDPEMDRAFEFCVNSMQESDMTGPPPGNTCSLSQIPGSPAYELTADQVAHPIRDGHEYVVQNNVWASNIDAQTITGLGTSFTISAQTNNNATNGAPASFPSAFIGSNHGRTSGTATLPKQVSAILASPEGVPTAWRWSGSGGGAYNAAYDIWFSTGPGGDAETPSATYMMVWLHSQGVQPLGTDHGQVEVDGRQWKFWYCGSACQDGVDVVTYVPLSSMNEYTFNLKPFMQHAVDNQRLQTGWYLTNVFAGFEVWNGGVGLKSDNFCAVVP